MICSSERRQNYNLRGELDWEPVYFIKLPETYTAIRRKDSVPLTSSLAVELVNICSLG